MLLLLVYESRIQLNSPQFSTRKQQFMARKASDQHVNKKLEKKRKKIMGKEEFQQGGDDHRMSRRISMRLRNVSAMANCPIKVDSRKNPP